jgi:transcriptional antiterminator
VEPSFPRSRAEEMMIQILSLSKDPISLTQIAKEIELSDPTILSGKTPRNSLYSIVYRREKRRELAGLSRLFSRQVIHREMYFTLQSQHN